MTINVFIMGISLFLIVFAYYSGQYKIRSRVAPRLERMEKTIEDLRASRQIVTSEAYQKLLGGVYGIQEDVLPKTVLNARK